MIYGKQRPVFYIYDSTGVTFVEKIALGRNTVATAMKPVRNARKNKSPIAKTLVDRLIGYEHEWVITAQQGDYSDDIVAYYGDMYSGPNDIYKLLKIQGYMDAGNQIRFVPRSDLLYLPEFNTTVGYYLVHTEITDMNVADGGNASTDKVVMQVKTQTPETALFIEADAPSGFAYTKSLDLKSASTQYVDVSTVDLGTRFSVEARFRLTSAISAGVHDPVLFGKNTTNDYVQIAYVGGQVRLYVVINAVSSYWPYAFASGTWYHLGLARLGADLRLMINGADQGDPLGTAPGASTNFEIYRIGNHSGGSTLLNGRISHVRGYSYDWVQEDANFQYNGGAGRTWLTGIFSPVFALEFDSSGGTGSTETDQVGSYDGTLINSPSRS